MRLTYIAPDNVEHGILVERQNGELVFSFAEIAQALQYANPENMTPACSKAHVRHIRFEGTPRARKAIVSGALFRATRLSTRDDWEADTGPAAHFHAWLRAVVLPLLEFPDFPPPERTVLKFQAAYLTQQIKTLSERLREVSDSVDQLTRIEASAEAVAAPDALTPHAAVVDFDLDAIFGSPAQGEEERVAQALADLKAEEASQAAMRKMKEAASKPKKPRSRTKII